MSDPKAAIALARRRDVETWRRTAQRALRKRAAEMGYDGTVRVCANGRNTRAAGSTSHRIKLAADPVLDQHRLEASIATGCCTTEAMATMEPLIELALLSTRRRTVIEAAGGDVREAPAWSYLGHPVARAMHAAMGRDLSTWRPNGDGPPPEGCKDGLAFNEFHIATQGALVQIGGREVKVHAAGEMARIQLSQELPNTLVAAMPGRALHQVLGLPGIEPGTAAGDAPIRKVIAKGGSTTILVESALEPMGHVPAGVDASFLDEWRMRHRV